MATRTDRLVKVVVTNVKSRNRPDFPSIGLRGHITYNNGG